MSPPSARRRDQVSVVIAASNPETLDGLQGYLGGAGVRARCTRDLAACTKLASELDRTIAVVLFPDDFRREKVVATLEAIARLRPTVRALLVTARPQELEKLAAADGAVLLPRPAWGWTILDAIRALLEPTRPGPEGGAP